MTQAAHSSPPPRTFATEAEMLPVLRDLVRTRWINKHPSHTWLLLEEQQMHSRIADLAVVRLDVGAMRARAKANLLRPLRLQELRALHALRPDRGASVAVIAEQMRSSRPRAQVILRELDAEGFVSREPTGTYRRLAPAISLAQRIIAIEAKRDDPRSALRQARSHRAWTDETFVAFDAAYAARFRKLDRDWRQLGIGLVELTPDSWRLIFRCRPHRRSNRLESALVGERALARVLGVAVENRPERRLPHGHLLSDESEPIVLGSKSRWVKELRRRSRA
jgi:hypothetical protein